MKEGEAEKRNIWLISHNKYHIRWMDGWRTDGLKKKNKMGER